MVLEAGNLFGLEDGCVSSYVGRGVVVVSGYGCCFSVLEVV